MIYCKPFHFLYFSHQIKGECDISSVLSLHAILSQDFSNVWAGRIQCLVNLMQHIPKMVVGRQVGQGSDGTWNSTEMFHFSVRQLIAFDPDVDLMRFDEIWLYLEPRCPGEGHSPFQHETVDLIGISADFQLLGFPAGTFAHLCCRVLTPVLPSNMVHR